MEIILQAGCGGIVSRPCCFSNSLRDDLMGALLFWSSGERIQGKIPCSGDSVLDTRDDLTCFRFFGDDDPGSDVRDHPDTDGEEGEYDPDDPDEVGVRVKVGAQPSADAAKQPVASRAI
jgi:hypothetical protein